MALVAKLFHSVVARATFSVCVCGGGRGTKLAKVKYFVLPRKKAGNVATPSLDPKHRISCV